MKRRSLRILLRRSLGRLSAGVLRTPLEMPHFSRNAFFSCFFLSAEVVTFTSWQVLKGVSWEGTARINAPSLARILNHSTRYYSVYYSVFSFGIHHLLVSTTDLSITLVKSGCPLIPTAQMWIHCLTCMKNIIPCQLAHHAHHCSFT